MFCGRSERCPAAEPGAGEHSQDCRSAEHERSRPGAHRPALWTDSQGLHAPSHRGGCTELHGDGVGVHADRRAFWKHTHGTALGPLGEGRHRGSACTGELVTVRGWTGRRKSHQEGGPEEPAGGG